MYYFAAGSGHYEDECGEGVGKRSETVGTGRPSRLVTKVHISYCKKVLKILLRCVIPVVLSNKKNKLNGTYVYRHKHNCNPYSTFTITSPKYARKL